MKYALLGIGALMVLLYFHFQHLQWCGQRDQMHIHNAMYFDGSPNAVNNAMEAVKTDGCW